MFSEIYTVFSRVTSYKDEIKNYFIETGRRNLSFFSQTNFERVLNHLHDDLEAAVVNGNFVAAYDDVQLFKDLTPCYSQIINDAERIGYLRGSHTFLRDSYKVYSYLQYSENDKFFCLYMDCIVSTLNLYTDAKISTELWTDISTRFFTKVSLADPVILFADGSLRELRTAVYDNITEEKDTWHGAVDFLSALYAALRANEKYIALPVLTKQRFWEAFIYSDTTNKSDFSSMTGTRFLTLPRAEELNKLYKAVIENNDVGILSAILLSVRSDYTDVVLANMILAYEAMFSQGVNDELFQTYEKVLSKHGSDFYFECIGRDIPSLDSHCKNIYGYIRGDWFMHNPRPDYIPFLPKYQTEFIFYWAIFHISFIDSAVLCPYILKMFDKNMTNIYNCFFYEGDFDAFKQRFRLFLEIVLGKWNTIEKNICVKAYDFCKDLFANYDFKSETDL